ncbi:MAG TPA: cupredoxin family copper-binding protein [Candidatus Limnocylindrales bacterium]|nr:cupredoxin family copper-binding protein [Candidatus Limnocylindrales bacterium]
MTGRSFRAAVARVGGAGLAALLMAVGGVSNVVAADHPVDIAGFAFSPGSVTVAVGDTVTWSNADVQSHTATADDASFDTGTIAGGTSKSVSFATAGTFAYHCKIHPSMTATIVVDAAAQPSAAPTPAPPAAATPRPSPPAAPATDAAAPAPPTTDPAGFGVFVLAALGGLVFAGRRLGRRLV